MVYFIYWGVTGYNFKKKKKKKKFFEDRLSNIILSNIYSMAQDI